MKRLIIYTLLTAFSFSFAPTDSFADSGKDRGRRERGEINPVLKMSPRKLSKHSAKIRRMENKNREKQLETLRKAQSAKK